jgi:SNF2 family DNA or RNA helicase
MLIVAPATLKGNWCDELCKFTRFEHLILDGTPAERNKQLMHFMGIQGPKVLIVNYEQVVSHYDTLDALRFDVTLFDEAHYLKNPKAKRTKACLDLYGRRSFMLTGTPMLNHVNELWTILHRIAPREFPSYWKFLNRYAVFGGYKDKQIIGVKNERELTERLQKYMLRRMKNDVMAGRTEPRFVERRVDLTPEQKKLYDSIIEDMKLPRLGEATPDDIENALTKFLRLKQICGTTLAFTGEDHSGKLDVAVADAIQMMEAERKIIVFTQDRTVQEAFCRRLDAAAPEYDIWELHGDVKIPDRQPIVNEWGNSPKAGVIVCMLQVAGVGLNMTAASDVFFLDELFVPGLNKQALDRADRIGQKNPVVAYKYITRGTIENRVQTILKTKSKLFGEIVETDPDWKRKLYQALTEEDE